MAGRLARYTTRLMRSYSIRNRFPMQLGNNVKGERGGGLIWVLIFCLFPRSMLLCAPYSCYETIEPFTEINWKVLMEFCALRLRIGSLITYRDGRHTHHEFGENLARRRTLVTGQRYIFAEIAFVSGRLIASWEQRVTFIGKCMKSNLVP